MKRSMLVLYMIILSCTVLFAGSDSNTGADNAVFKEAEVYPLYRLPDKDITVVWSTPSPEGIKIIYGDKEISQGPEGKYIIPASELTSMPESFTIKLKVNSKDGEEQTMKIETFDKTRTITKTGEQFGATERYTITFPEKEWDSDLRIEKIELHEPQSYYCGRPAIETRTKWEYYKENDKKVDGFLRWDNEYKSDQGLPAAASGAWTFRLWNFFAGHYCADLQPFDLSPEVFFTIGSNKNQ